MIDLDIPGRGPLHLEYLLVDLNGTLSLDGVLEPGVAEKITSLAGTMTICLVTADTRNKAAGLARELGVELIRIEGDEREAKARALRTCGAPHTAAMGNGSNDSLMIREAALGICVLGREGASPETLMASDVVVTSSGDGLELLLKPERLIATLRR